MFGCKVNKTVLRMDIGACFRHLIWKPHFVNCDEIFRKLAHFEVKVPVIEFTVNWGGGGI
jgi:hypothetical protein